MVTADSVRAFREGKKWSQQQLAEKLGVDQATVSRIERGTQPSGPVARLLEILLREPVSPSDAQPVEAAA